MTVFHAQAPDGLPVLSRGKHRTARKGACFMELASFLAGERWTDHPACTHPLLAELARQVNDHTPDSARSPLALLIPSVIGTTTNDLRVDARIAIACARAALPVVAAERQNVMAVGLLTAERVLTMLEDRPLTDLSTRTQVVLADHPAAASYAYRYTLGAGVSPLAFRRHAAPHVVRLAVQGIAAACMVDPYAELRDLLGESIELCRAALAPSAAPAPVEPAAWAAACQLTGSR